jgi:H/ACA ribonucleoprotein complex non-core subunit NAF1
MVEETKVAEAISAKPSQPGMTEEGKFSEHFLSSIEDFMIVEDTPAGEIPRTKNEVLPDLTSLELNPVEYVTDTLIEFGVVQHYTEMTLVIIGAPGRLPLDLDSTVCTKDGRVLGPVEDVFGPITDPYYAVKTAHYLEPGTPVYYAQTSAKPLKNLKHIPGSDASNRYDEEIPQEEQEQSDDEKESLKRKKRRRRN